MLSLGVDVKGTLCVTCSDVECIMYCFGLAIGVHEALSCFYTIDFHNYDTAGICKSIDVTRLLIYQILLNLTNSLRDIEKGL